MTDIKNVPFVKMSGCGNDFVVIDNRQLSLIFDTKKIQSICAPHIGIGADGILLLEESAIADMKMMIYNSDGSRAQMCGNGARCILSFAQNLGIIKNKGRIETDAGIVDGKILKEGLIEIRFEISSQNLTTQTIETTNKERIEYHLINTGVPHLVVFSEGIERLNILELGCFFRNHALFKPEGVNVDFVNVINRKKMSIRTYERGVESETLSCGTGVAAAALVAQQKGYVDSLVEVNTQGGVLTFESNHKNEFYLRGPVQTVFVGAFNFGND